MGRLDEIPTGLRRRHPTSSDGPLATVQNHGRFSRRCRRIAGHRSRRLALPEHFCSRRALARQRAGSLVAWRANRARRYRAQATTRPALAWDVLKDHDVRQEEGDKGRAHVQALSTTTSRKSYETGIGSSLPRSRCANFDSIRKIKPQGPARRQFFGGVVAIKSESEPPQSAPGPPSQMPRSRFVMPRDNGTAIAHSAV